MSRHAYLVLTDLHYSPSKENRLNYFAEIIHVIQQVIDLRNELCDSGYDVNLILLGDVIDSGIRNSEDAMRCLDFFRYLSSLFNNVYSVVGNHETSYIANNPFWFMVSELSDESLSYIRRPIQPQSLHACMKVPSVVEDGNVSFFFNHHGTPVKIPSIKEGKINIGLFHQNLGSNEICKMWGVYQDVEKVSFSKQYDYLYMGHMHLASGEYELCDSDHHSCRGVWLGSCVGTNVTEVEELSEKPLVVPVVLIEDNQFKRVDYRELTRKSAKESIDYYRLNLSKQVMPRILKDNTVGALDCFTGSLYERVTQAATMQGIDGFIYFLQGDEIDIYKEYRNGLMQVALPTENIEKDGEDD